MFGYGKRQIVGMNISTIMPPPMSLAHDSYLKAFISTGHEVR